MIKSNNIPSYIFRAVHIYINCLKKSCGEICTYLTSDAMKFEPYKMCPSAFSTTFWQFFDFILQISYDKTFKIRYVRCLYIII